MAILVRTRWTVADRRDPDMVASGSNEAYDRCSSFDRKSRPIGAVFPLLPERVNKYLVGILVIFSRRKDVVERFIEACKERRVESKEGPREGVLDRAGHIVKGLVPNVLESDGQGIRNKSRKLSNSFIDQFKTVVS